MDPDIDDSAWPIVIVRWQGTIPDERLSFFLAQLNLWLDRGERFGLLLDSRNAAGLSPEQRGRLVAHMREHAPRTTGLLVQAIVIDNLVQRTLFYGINLLFPNPFPSKVFSEPEAARVWLEAVLNAPPISNA